MTGYSRKHSPPAAEEHEGPQREANYRASSKDSENLYLTLQFCAFPTYVYPHQVEVEALEFSVSERKLYDSIYIDVRKKFLRLNEKGLVNKNYTSILAMLMRRVLPFPRSNFNLDLSGNPDSVGPSFTLISS